MKLREKILLLSGLALTVTAYLLYFTSSRIFLHNFEILEAREAARAAQQAAEALASRVDAILTIDADWARWDDAYNFMSEPTDRFKTSNLNNESLAGLGLNLIAFVAASGDVVYETGFDYIDKKFRPVPDDAERTIVRSKDLLARCLRGEAIKGLANLGGNALMLAAHPILTSEAEGPARGMLVMARWMDAHEAMEVHRLARQRVELLPADSPLAADVRAADFHATLDDPRVRVRALGDTSVAGFQLLDDVFGKPAFALQATLPRDIVLEGRKTMALFLAALVVIGLVATVVVAALFERLVLTPLARLRADLAWTAARGVLSGRLPVAGGDEVAMTAREVNRLLDAMEQIHLGAQQRVTRHGTEVEQTG